MKNVLKIFLFFVICFLIVGCGSGNNIEIITTDEVKEIISNKDENYIIIDVREPYEFDEGHLPGAVNIPWTTIDSVTYDKDKILIVYCRSGSRSHEAARILVDMGYNVKDMGGILDWKYELKGA